MIEEDVAEMLPSVKKLAQIYAAHDNHVIQNGSVPLHRPKVSVIFENFCMAFTEFKHVCMRVIFFIAYYHDKL